MDWTGCKINGFVKSVKEDKPLVSSLLKSSSKKLYSGNLLVLNENTASSKISLIYDSLRELLEALALMQRYKIYNHECYCAFLKEVMNKSSLGSTFDGFRRLRNGVNYYGEDITAAEAEHLIKEMNEFINTIKNEYFSEK